METTNTTNITNVTPDGRKMPDLPALQVIAVVGSIIATAVAFGLDVTAEQKAAIEDLMRNLMAIGAGDVMLRVARNAFSR